MMRFIIPSMLACAIAGCRDRPPQPDAVQVSAPELTAEQAKDAMIELIRSSDPGRLGDFPLARFANDKVQTIEGDKASWACFWFDLKTKKYTYREDNGLDGKARYLAECEGSFEFRHGKWVAVKPRVLSET